MLTEEQFLRLIRDELALPLAHRDLSADFDQVVSWDSIHMLRLATALERELGRRIPVGRLLEDRSLRAIYDRVTADPTGPPRAPAG